MKKVLLMMLATMILCSCVSVTKERNEQFIEEAHSQGFEVFYFKDDEYAINRGYGIVYTEEDGEVSIANKGILKYKQYVGKFCYFKEPIEGKNGIQFLPLVIETGEIVYVQFKAGSQGNSPTFIYGNVVSYDKLVEAQKLISSKFCLFEDYDVWIEAVEIYSYGEKYFLSDGNIIWKSTYDFLYDLVSKLSFENDEDRKSFISSVLDLQISTLYDDFDEKTTVSVYATENIKLSAYVYNDGSYASPSIRLLYSGSNWKFIDLVRMKSDSLEYSFYRDSYRSVLSGGSVLESVIASLNSKTELFNFLKSAYENGSLKIRMSGSRGAVDLSIDSEQLHRIGAFLRLIDYLENN